MEYCETQFVNPLRAEEEEEDLCERCTSPRPQLNVDIPILSNQCDMARVSRSSFSIFLLLFPENTYFSYSGAFGRGG